MARNPETRKNVGKNRHVIENAYNYLIQGAASWIKQGQDRVALRNLAKAHLARMGQKATMQNIKRIEDQIKAASVLVSDMDSVPSYPMEKRSTPARESVTDIPGYEKYIQDIERQSPFVPIGVEEKIRLKTNTGKTGYKITQFQIIGTAPGTGNVEYVGKITNVKDPNVGATVNFTNSDLLAVSYLKEGASEDKPFSQGIIFDNQVVNQDIFVAI